MGNQSAGTKPESWKSKKSGFKGKWHSAITIPLMWFEWVCEWMAFGLKRWAFIEIIENLGKLSVLFALVLFITESDERANLKSHQAWQVVTTAYGKPGDLGRIVAIQDLADQNYSLLEVDVSNAYLRRLDIGDKNAMAWGAKFNDTDLKAANLRGTRFSAAHFERSKLHYADLSNTKLDYTYLRCAEFIKANLRNASLEGAHLEFANFYGANLEGANLLNIKNFKEIYCIKGANLKNVEASDDFLLWARSKGALNIRLDSKKEGAGNGITNSEKWTPLEDEFYKMDDAKIQKYHNDNGIEHIQIKKNKELNSHCCK